MEHFFPSSLPHCWLTLLREKSLTFRWSHWNLGTVLVIVISFILIKVRECIWILYITTTLDNSYYHSPLGLPRWLRGKEPICQCRRRRWYGFDPWDRKIPWRRKQQPTPVFFLENLMGRGAWWATVHGVAKRQTRLSSTRCPFTVSWALCWGPCIPTQVAASQGERARWGHVDQTFSPAWSAILGQFAHRVPHHF